MALLKDADGLDRVRIGDLDPRYLRTSEALEMLDFAEQLMDETCGRIPTGSGHFKALLTHAAGILGCAVPIPTALIERD